MGWQGAAPPARERFLATFGHRLMDGVHAAQMIAEFKKCFAEPAKYFA
jgi:hypothetical protein